MGRRRDRFILRYGASYCRFVWIPPVKTGTPSTISILEGSAIAQTVDVEPRGTGTNPGGVGPRSGRITRHPERACVPPAPTDTGG